MNDFLDLCFFNCSLFCTFDGGCLLLRLEFFLSIIFFFNISYSLYWLFNFFLLLLFFSLDFIACLMVFFFEDLFTFFFLFRLFMQCFLRRLFLLSFNLLLSDGLSLNTMFLLWMNNCFNYLLIWYLLFMICFNFHLNRLTYFLYKSINMRDLLVCFSNVLIRLLLMNFNFFMLSIFNALNCLCLRHRCL